MIATIDLRKSSILARRAWNSLTAAAAAAAALCRCCADADPLRCSRVLLRGAVR